MSDLKWKAVKTVALQRIVFQVTKLNGIGIVKARHERRGADQKTWKKVTEHYYFRDDPDGPSFRNELELRAAVDRRVKAEYE